MDRSSAGPAVSDWRVLDRIPLVALFAANLVPLFGVFYLQWDAAGLLILYWLENLVIGFYALLKMLHAGGPLSLFTGPFFVVHYGGFCAIHGFFIVGLSGMGVPELGGGTAFGPLVFVELLWNVIVFVAGKAPEAFYLPLLALAVSHGISFVAHHLVRGEDVNRPVRQLMSEPYKRIVVLHVAILAGGFAAMKMDSPLGMLLALVALKIGLDIYLHRRAHRQQSTRPAREALA